MKAYSVKQLSELAGVSVKTLHHYDRIGLLNPAGRSEAGYRYYYRKELLRLQQILFYRNLDVPLKEIREILDDPGFDLVGSLKFHRQQLEKRAERLKGLLKTIDKTIDELENSKDMKDEDIYAGFSKEEAHSYRQEVIERWGKETLNDSENRIKAMGKEGFQDLKAWGENINQELAKLIDRSPADEEVQKLVAQHYEMTSNYLDVSEERYRGFGKMYVEDPRFKAYYDNYREGLAEFLNQAIQWFCDQGMKA